MVIPAVADKEGIEDRTETNLVNLRRVIYLTIMNALNYEEAVHKLLKVQLKEGQEVRQTFTLRPYCTNSRIDRIVQYDHRMLLTRAILLDFLRSHRRALLQAKPSVERML